MKSIILTLFLFIGVSSLYAQTVTVEPEFFNEDEQITITVSNLSWQPHVNGWDVYLWAWWYDLADVQQGDSPTNGTWKDSDPSQILTDNGDGSFSITFVPSTLYATTGIGKIGFLFKDNNGDYHQTGNFTHEVEPYEVYTYNAGTWTPNAPDDSVNPATPTDDILIQNGTATLTSFTEIEKLTINSGDTLKIQHVLKVHDNILNNGSLVFLSNSTGTGQLAEMNGWTINGSGTETVQRYIPARDTKNGDTNGAYRFITAAVNSTASINTNWQEGADNISQDPTNGYGMFITGPANTTPPDNTNGLDATPAGEYSLFIWDVGTQQWLEEISTNRVTDKLKVGAPYLAYVWGDRSLDIIANNDVVPTSTILRAKGNLVTGDFTFSGFAPVPNKYNFFGNPYQAIVDMNEVLPNGTPTDPAFYWVWDPNLNVRGAYAMVNLTAGTTAPNTSQANQYLMPGQAAFLEGGTKIGSSLTFHESDKAALDNNGVLVPQTDVFRPEQTTFISVQLYNRKFFVNGGPLSDAFRIEFSPGASNAVLLNDIGKMHNIDENLGRMNGTELLIVEHRDMPVDGEVLPLFNNNYRFMDYTFKVEVNGISDITAYLKDNYTGTTTKIPAGITNIDFSVDTTIPASIATDRFSIVFAKKPLGINDDLSKQTLSIYPNPVRNGEFTIALQDMAGENVHISMYNMLGQRVYRAVMEVGGNDRIAVKASQLKAGVYFVEMAHEGKTFTEKIIVQQH